MMANIAKRSCENFEPFSELKSEQEYDTLLLHLPGFKKEQLSVQVTSSRILKICGERPISDNKWRRFRKEVQLPSYIDTHEIIPKFLEGILHIRQKKFETPELFEQEDHQGQKLDEEVAPEPQPQVLQQEPTPEVNFEEKDEAGETSEAPKPQLEELPPEPQPQILQHEASSEEKKDEAGETSEAPQPQVEELPPAPQPQILEHEASSEEKTDEMTGLEDEMDEQLEHGGGIFQELRRPEHLKRLAINVFVLLIVLGYFISQIFISFTKKVEEPSIAEYDNQEL